MAQLAAVLDQVHVGLEHLVRLEQSQEQLMTIVRVERVRVELSQVLLMGMVVSPVTSTSYAPEMRRGRSPFAMPDRFTSLIQQGPGATRFGVNEHTHDLCTVDGSSAPRLAAHGRGRGGGLSAWQAKADAGQRFLAVQQRREPVEGSEEVDEATRKVMVPLGMRWVDAVRVVRPVVPVEPEASRSWPQEEVVRVPGEGPEAANQDPGLDEVELGDRESAPSWVRDRDDDRPWAVFLARDIHMAQASERAFDRRDPLVELLRTESGHARPGAEWCSAETSRQIWSLSAGVNSRRVTASSSPSSSMSALSGIR